MSARAALLVALAGAGGAWAEPVPVSEPAPEPDAVARCLSCHVAPAGPGAGAGALDVAPPGALDIVAPSGALDIVGIGALEALPAEWPLMSEDAFDLDGDGIAGVARHVSGGDGLPVLGRYGRALAAGRLEDFARIAGEAHGIDLSEPAVLARVVAVFAERSPDPAPMPPGALARFEARGCASCHVTDAFGHDGRDYRPLSDFLLHDLGAGPVRTAPLWGCPGCLEAPGHGAAAGDAPG